MGEAKNGKSAAKEAADAKEAEESLKNAEMGAAKEAGHAQGEADVIAAVKDAAKKQFKEKAGKANPHDGTIWKNSADCQREFPEGGCVLGVNNWIGTNQKK